MSSVLSAEEIARLFEGAREGTLPDNQHAQAHHTRSVHKIDFSRPMKLSLVEQRRFEKAHASFCKQAGEHLSSELRATIELEVIDCSQLTWRGALDDAPQPSILGVAACAADEAIAICVERGLILRIIERQLGGNFADTPAARDLTEIDTMLARHAFELLIAPLSAVWQDLLGLSLRFVALEVHDTSLEYTPDIQPTLALTLEVRDELTSATIVLLVPHTAIEAASKQLDRRDGHGVDGHPGEGHAAGNASMRAALGDTSVEVRAEAGAVSLTLGEILALARGDIVRLGGAGHAGIVVGEDRLHEVRVGLSGRQRAVQIIEPARVDK
ncbi:MAG TPA: FliM/FliN family flagellar motor switch protein [Solirubrobacteraceae bacterium]|nr:FliM/FliN family flagellar motor switch protein [Solirubrobacteraceae bacterium]